MADYGVGGDTWSALDWSWAGTRLAATRNYWVTTVGPDGQPHSMPVWGVWDDESLRFMFSCSPNARKARDLGNNPRLTFTTDNSVECVSVQATARRISDPSELQGWITLYVSKYGDEIGADQPGAAEEMAEFVASHACYEATPSAAFAIIERADEFAERATRWRFTER